MTMQHAYLPVIGRNTLIDIVGHVKGVPAKIDTGADSSSIWATDVHVDEQGVLSFRLLGKKSPHYTGEIITRRRFIVAIVRSSSGHEQVRYRIKLPILVKDKRVNASFYLADRSRNDFPILLGRRTLNKKFLVDVSQHEYEAPTK